ncbi:anti-sigma factor [Enterovirga sp.]|uniref:anti-sigma factor n=1 Tax=Enterovirga sp. TaxID=2026350 RepID=UPI002C526E1E|nr:anti-sigma factor [Enterovirga sp.]HMO28014.1 anti-sigma factor [Enterovirga sp.]
MSRPEPPAEEEDPAAGEPLRLALLRGERARTRRRRLSVLGPAGFCLVLGGAAGWHARDFAGGPHPTAGRAWAALAGDALAAYRAYAPETAHPVEAGAGEAHLAQWLSQRLGFPLLVPDLSEPFGLALVGGRLLPAGPGLAAFLMYADASGRRVILYVRPGERGEAAFNFLREGEVSSFSWIEGGTGYAVAAATDREQLLKLARALLRDYELEAARRRKAL